MSKVLTLTKDNFNNEVLNSDKPVLVDFWASWCGPCKMIAPVIEELADETDAVKICKLNVDDEMNIAGKYDVMSIPTLILFNNGEPVKKSVGLKSKQELMSFIGIEEDAMLDAVIIGAGTAGMTAGIYLARRGKSAVILENNAYGGQIINSREIANYPGIKNVSGFDFATGLYEQVTGLGGRIEFADVKEIKPNGECKTVVTADGEYKCKSIIIASGAVSKKLGLENEDNLIGRGVSYCATCDGAFFRGRTAAVVGGGNTALDDAKFLAEICEKVYLIHRRDEFRGDSKTVSELKETENVEFVLNTVPTELKTDNDGMLCGVAVENKESGAAAVLNISGLFAAVGQVPNTAFLKNSGIELDSYGYIIAGEDCRTNIEDVYAAGDCRTKNLRQLTTAAADGSVAATAVK